MTRAAGKISSIEKRVLRDLMDRSGISRGDLSADLGVSVNHVRNILNGSNRSGSLLYKVASCFGLPAEPDFGFVELDPRKLGVLLKGELPTGSTIILPKKLAVKLAAKLREVASKKAMSSAAEKTLRISDLKPQTNQPKTK